MATREEMREQIDDRYAQRIEDMAMYYLNEKYGNTTPSTEELLQEVDWVTNTRLSQAEKDEIMREVENELGVEQTAETEKPEKTAAEKEQETETLIESQAEVYFNEMESKAMDEGGLADFDGAQARKTAREMAEREVLGAEPEQTEQTERTAETPAPTETGKTADETGKTAEGTETAEKEKPEMTAEQLAEQKRAFVFEYVDKESFKIWGLGGNHEQKDKKPILDMLVEKANAEWDKDRGASWTAGQTAGSTVGVAKPKVTEQEIFERANARFTEVNKLQNMTPEEKKAIFNKFFDDEKQKALSTGFEVVALERASKAPNHRGYWGAIAKHSIGTFVTSTVISGATTLMVGGPLMGIVGGLTAAGVVSAGAAPLLLAGGAILAGSVAALGWETIKRGGSMVKDLIMAMLQDPSIKVGDFLKQRGGAKSYFKGFSKSVKQGAIFGLISAATGPFANVLFGGVLKDVAINVVQKAAPLLFAGHRAWGVNKAEKGWAEANGITNPVERFFGKAVGIGATFTAVEKGRQTGTGMAQGIQNAGQSAPEPANEVSPKEANTQSAGGNENGGNENGGDETPDMDLDHDGHTTDGEIARYNEEHGTNYTAEDVQNGGAESGQDGAGQDEIENDGTVIAPPLTEMEQPFGDADHPNADFLNQYGAIKPSLIESGAVTVGTVLPDGHVVTGGDITYAMGDRAAQIEMYNTQQEAIAQQEIIAPREGAGGEIGDRGGDDMGLTPVTADNGVEHGKIEPKFMDKIVAKGLDGKGVRAEGRATDDLESAEDSQNFTRQDRAYEDFVRRESAAMGFRDLLRVGDDNIGREGIGEESAGGNGVGEEPPLTTNVGGIKKPAFESAEDLQRYYTKPNPAGEEYGRDLDFEKLGRDFGGEDGIYDPSNAADVGRLRAYEESYNSAFAEQEQTAINNAGNVPKEYTEEQVIENHGAGLHVGDTITDENGAVRTVTDINADGSHSTDRTDYNIDEQSVTREQWQANEMELNARVKSSAVTIEEMRAEDPSEITVGSAWNKGGRSAYDRAFEQYVRQENAVTGDMREYDLDSAREVDPGIYDVKNTSRGTVDRIAITRNADRSYNATQTHSFAPEQYMSLDGLKTGISALGAQGVLDHGTVLAARDQGLEVVGRYDNDTYVVQDSAGNRSFIDATKGAGPDGAWNYGVRANLGDLRPLSQPEPERTQ